jgi:RHS repeat-associated protein
MKNRVVGSDERPSGRLSNESEETLEIATGSHDCAYETASGRRKWLNRDPLGERGGINLYRFVYNNPLAYVDPNGDNPILLAILAGAVCGAIMTPGTVNAPGPNEPIYPFLTPGDIAANAAGGAAFGCVLGVAGRFSSPSLKPITCPVSRWGRPGLQPGDWVMDGNPTFWNYAMSGKYQPPWMPGGNTPAAFSSGQTFFVPPSSLQYPPGFFGPIKGALGQRIYSP